MKSVVASLLCAAAVVVVSMGFGGCKEAEEIYDCALICEAYDDCASELGQDIDYTGCVSHCEDQADMIAGFTDKARDCQNCLEKRQSCAESFVCAAECGDVVPSVAF